MPRFWTRYTVRQRIQAFVSLMVVYIPLQLLLSRILQHHHTAARLSAALVLATAFVAGTWSLIYDIVEGLSHSHQERRMSGSKAEGGADVDEPIRHRVPDLGREGPPGQTNRLPEKGRAKNSNRRHQVDVVQCVEDGKADRERVTMLRSPVQSEAATGA